MPKEKKKSNLMKFELGVSIAVIAALVIIVAVLLFGQQNQQPNQTKISTVPAEIKSQPEAANLEKDTSSILSEVGDTLNNIDKSLPEV